MITLKKTPGKDFIVLNLTDTQLYNEEWEEGHKSRVILTRTISELIKEKKPDLITVTGDLAWSGHDISYDALADFLDSFGIPWAPVWGNHDNQGGAEKVDAVATRYLSHPLCVYEKGDPKLGNGNYVIAIEEEGRIVEGIIMMDSHDRMTYTAPNGAQTNEWAKLTPEQLIWYRGQIETLKALGCYDTTLMMHIPIYAYREAWNAAAAPIIDPRSITPENSAHPSNWNEGYTDSFGVKYEDICSYPEDEGMFSLIKELGSTKHIVCGHDHVNNFVVNYKGVKFIYGLKAGTGCYWNPILNGGTLFRITQKGVTEVWHKYVDVSEFL